MTSVGSGSLIIVALLFLYPALSAGQIVGTDLVQAVPLVASAALGHLLFADFQLDVTTSLLIGTIPGVYIGARCSARASQSLIRRALVVVLIASALKLLGAGNELLLAALFATLLLGPAVSPRRSAPPTARGGETYRRAYPYGGRLDPATGVWARYSRTCRQLQTG